MSRKLPNLQFKAGHCIVDLGRGRVFRDGTEVSLRPKSFALLAYMVQRAGRVFAKDELLGAVWPDVIVTEDSLTQCIHEIRQALGAEAAALLRTVPRRGYLFADAAAQGAGVPEPSGHVAPGLSVGQLLRRNGIAVLPFTLVAPSNPGDGALADGLAQDVISRLARMRGFHVIARGSTFALRHLAGDPQAAGRALGVVHVVTGTAMIRDMRLRLQIDIVEAEGAGILWSGEFSEDLRAFADLIGSMSDRIAFTIQRQISASETRRAIALPSESLTAWEHFHAGLGDIYSTDPMRLGAALGHFRAAAALEPRFARAHSGQSVCHWVMAFSGMAADPAAEAAAARRSAEAGLEADEDDPYTQ